MSEFNANTVPAAPTTTAGYWLGGWVFIPATLGSIGDRRDAYLEREGERVPLLHCSVDLTQFVELMIGIEAELAHDDADAPERE
ncbi:hypothetical protein [Streptomyces sp.]|uniref:hypothetical protein n=1 Tax=Streptomyces sp. TaxID=1931 RepID=UPI002F421FEC